MNQEDKVDFSKKISTLRPYAKNASSAVDHQYLAEQFESDRGRIIQSAAIRRLQQKTQVFPLEKNSAVRSRLTHSLEVQQTGRHIVRTIFKKLSNEQLTDLNLVDYEREIETLVEMACLMHDIGNPPFGHFGESAINHWFAKELDQHVVFSQANDKMLGLQLKLELKSFEGNAQAYRIIFNLLKLNLTFSQSASILKYTRSGLERKPEADKPLSYLKKKVGYYYSEIPTVDAMRTHLDIKPGHRYPLAYLMEAADDISYCLADIEDGVEKGLLTCFHLAEYLKQTFERLAGDKADTPITRNKSFSDAVDYALNRSDKEPINKAHEFFVWLRVQLIHPLVDHAAQRFIDNVDGCFHGNLNSALLEDDSVFHHMIETFKDVAIKHIFSTAEVETKELQGYRVIAGLLDAYAPLLKYPKDKFLAMVTGEQRGGLIEARLYKRLPKKHLKAYQAAIEEAKSHSDFAVLEFYYRCRLIQDFISGMTDQFAFEEAQNLSAF
jgi:dGTPase